MSASAATVLPVTATASGASHSSTTGVGHDFVTWLRTVAPYIHAFRNKTFVIAFPGELVTEGRLESLVHDVALLQAMGMRIVLTYGSRPQVEEQLRLRKIEDRYSHGMRITDRPALECAKEAAGELRLDIEAAFSAGLPNTPMGNSRIRIISGNFVTARPVGIVDGIDFEHTGLVRKVEVESIAQALSGGSIVLVPPLGFSPTGDAFNLTLEDVAASLAVALDADKLIYLVSDQGVPRIQDADDNPVIEISEDQAERLLAKDALHEEAAFTLSHALRACRGGVERAHMVPFTRDGALLIELFTHDGVGVMLVEETLEALRPATPDDVAAIVSLIEPLETDGTLVPRGRNAIERDIDRFTVIEHDGVIFGCAALYHYGQSTLGELACLMVRPDTREKGDGERLLKRIEHQARQSGLRALFVLTTRTTHWFLKRGFKPATVDELPEIRQKAYNWDRKSQVLIKTL
ncbi:MAG: amino-acid N-acetyltransferase [Burkholderiaceae bacterium]|jgi:amino-acid N-acetyltransferase|nr:amino-acid N-acetyltransferase [Betaproteobacteria bacterium]